MAGVILNTLREEHVPMAKFVFTPPERVFGVSPLIRNDLVSTVNNAIEFQFEK
jgi:hypothetical protein